MQGALWVPTGSIRGSSRDPARRRQRRTPHTPARRTLPPPADSPRKEGDTEQQRRGLRGRVSGARAARAGMLGGRATDRQNHHFQGALGVTAPHRKVAAAGGGDWPSSALIPRPHQPPRLCAQEETALLASSGVKSLKTDLPEAWPAWASATARETATGEGLSPRERGTLGSHRFPAGSLHTQTQELEGHGGHGGRRQNGFTHSLSIRRLHSRPWAWSRGTRTDTAPARQEVKTHTLGKRTLEDKNRSYRKRTRGLTLQEVSR